MDEHAQKALEVAEMHEGLAAIEHQFAVIEEQLGELLDYLQSKATPTDLQLDQALASDEESTTLN
jgi:hypothetical protein